MIVRLFESSDYPEVCTWWTKQEWPIIPLQAMSPSGFIAEDNGKRLAATWIFATNCPIYIMEWTVGNPDISWEERALAIDKVTSAGCSWAKQDGALQVFTMTKSNRFIDKLKSNGFIKTDDGMTHLIRSL